MYNLFVRGYMKDIDFGNYLYQLRKDNNLSQKYVTYKLGI